MTRDKLEAIARLNQEYGVPYTEIESLLDLSGTPLRVIMHNAGYRASTSGPQFRRKLSNEQVAAVQEAYMTGVEQDTLAAIAGVSRQTIGYHTRGMRGRKLSDGQRQAIKDAITQGASLATLAMIANVHPALISLIAKEID